MQLSDKGKSLAPLLVLMSGAVCVSFAAIFVKLIGEARLGPTAVGFWRTLFGGLILILLATAGRRRVVLNPRLFLFSLLAGFIFFLDLFFWHRSIYCSGAGMATVLANTQVFFTALLSFLVFRERLSVRFFASAAGAVIGITLLVGLIGEEITLTTRYLEGVAFGLATGIVYAHYLVTVKWSGQNGNLPEVVTFMAWTSLFAAMFLGTAGLMEPGPMVPPDLQSLGLLLALAVVAQALGWCAITGSLRKLDASRAGLILLLQPTLAMVWGVLFFAEQLTFSQAVGAAVTLAAIYFGGLKK